MRLVALCLLPLMVCLACTAALPVHVQATIYSTENCPPCIRYITAVRAQLPKRGLIVRDADAKDAASADIVITKTPTPGVEIFPMTIIRKNGHEVRRVIGELSPLKLAELLDE